MGSAALCPDFNSDSYLAYSLFSFSSSRCASTWLSASVYESHALPRVLEPLRPGVPAARSRVKRWGRVPRLRPDVARLGRVPGAVGGSSKRAHAGARRFRPCASVAAGGRCEP